MTYQRPGKFAMNVGRTGAARRLPQRSRHAWVAAGVAVMAAAMLALAPTRAGSTGLHGDDTPDLGGWHYLMRRLAADGVDRRRLEATFSDARFPAFDGLDFSIAPREPRSIYRGFLHSSSVAGARRCAREHASELAAAEQRFGVDSHVVAAILFVETHCGQNTGSYRILPRLSRLAMANEPENLRRNIDRHEGELSPNSLPPQLVASLRANGSLSDEDPLPNDLVERAVRSRAAYLEATFYKEVLGTFRVADRLGIDPLEIRGSGSGAFGLPQFLPSSYLAYGADGDGDGRVSLFDTADAISSCARYLQANGWHEGLTFADRRQVIWTYNHSPAYVDTVLALADRIDSSGRAGADVDTISTSTGRSRTTAKSAAKRSGKGVAKSKGTATSSAHRRNSRDKAVQTTSRRAGASRSTPVSSAGGTKPPASASTANPTAKSTDPSKPRP